MTMGELSGRIALVTGASRGLGKGIALVLAEKGADVVVNYHASAAEAEEVAQACRQFGVRALALQANVGRADEVEALLRAIDEQLGPIDFLINNAGTSRAENIFDITEESWDALIQTNLKSMFLCSKQAMLRMREHHF